jgi:protein involved in polysaccharide export with SLBB domain
VTLASSNAPSARTVVTYIVGAINRPGAYTLPATARAQDLVNTAGGATADADRVRVRLEGRSLVAQWYMRRGLASHTLIPLGAVGG